MEGQTKKEEREKENKMRWKEVEGEVITRNYKDIDSGNNSKLNHNNSSNHNNINK